MSRGKRKTQRKRRYDGEEEEDGEGKKNDEKEQNLENKRRLREWNIYVQEENDRKEREHYLLNYE